MYTLESLYIYPAYLWYVDILQQDRWEVQHEKLSDPINYDKSIFIRGGGMGEGGEEGETVLKCYQLFVS